LLSAVRQLLNEMLLDLPPWKGICPAGGSASSWKIKCRVGRGLGPLLARAHVAVPILRQKAEEWALLSHGCFPVALGSNCYELMEWSRACREPQFASNIHWPSVLAQHDTLCRLGCALATTTSNGPAGPGEDGLAGCCRVGIYFLDVGGVLALLETLRLDPEVRVIQ
jgi:hypothetical protein